MNTFLFFLFQITLSISIEYDKLMLIGDFFTFKNTKALNLVLCSKKDAFTSLEYFMFNYNKSNFILNTRSEQKNFISGIKGQNYRIGVFIDLTCEKNKNIFNQASELGFFNTSYAWLAFSDYVEPFQNAFLRSTADLTMFGEDQMLYHVERSRADYDVKMHKIGLWNDGNLVVKRRSTVRSLDGEIMIASIFLTREIYDKMDRKKLSEQILDNGFHTGEDLPNRFSYPVNLAIGQLFNFSLVLKFSDHWGAVLRNGTHIGMTGQIQRNEANVTLGGAKYLKERFDTTDPLMTMHEYWFPFVFIQPRVLGSYRALSMPLTPSVWLSLAFLILASSLTFTITRNYGDSKYTKDTSMSENFLQFIGVFSQQGLTVEPYHFSSRLVCIFMLLVGTLVAVYYNGATMNALLSANPPSIKTIEDLVNSNIKLALINALYFRNKAVRNRLIPKIAYDKVDKFMPETYPLQEGLELIRQGKAFCGEYFWLYFAVDKYFDEELKCQLSIVLPYPPFPVTGFVNKHTHLRELFNQGIIRMKENGISNRELIRWFPKKPKCIIKKAFVIVRLEAISIALFIFLIGVVISLIIFVFEFRQNYKSKIRPFIP